MRPCARSSSRRCWRSNPVSPLLAQRLIAAPFLVLGAWCVLAPGMVERLGVRPEYYHGDTTTALLIACFGAQAVLSGLFAAFSRFTRVTFLVYGIAAAVLLVQLLVRVRGAGVQ